VCFWAVTSPPTKRGLLVRASLSEESTPIFSSVGGEHSHLQERRSKLESCELNLISSINLHFLTRKFTFSSSWDSC
jgi:hypothetical protein